jgi:hypothetical protein
MLALANVTSPASRAALLITSRWAAGFVVILLALVRIGRAELHVVAYRASGFFVKKTCWTAMPRFSSQGCEPFLRPAAYWVVQYAP